MKHGSKHGVSPGATLYFWGRVFAFVPHPVFETLTRALFAARVCIVVTQPCDLRWHKHQQKKHRKFCSGFPGAVLADPFTNSVRKRRSFSDVNNWRSYEQCLFFSCFVCCVHVNMGVRMNVRMPVGFDSTALPFLFVTCLCVWWVQRSLPFLISPWSDHFHFQASLLTILNATLFWMFGPFVAPTSNQHQNFKTFRRTWSCKVCQDCGENHPENCQSAPYFTTRSTVKNWGMRTPLGSQ